MLYESLVPIAFRLFQVDIHAIARILPQVNLQFIRPIVQLLPAYLDRRREIPRDKENNILIFEILFDVGAYRCTILIICDLQ